MEDLLKIGIVCSAGGHLVQSLLCLEAFKDCKTFLVTYDAPNLAGFRDYRLSAIYSVRYLGDSYIRIATSLFLSVFTFFKILIKERPDVLFSTGSEIAIPAFFLAKFLFRSKLIYLESLTRVTTVSGTGKIVYPISDLFLVQSEKLLAQLGSRALYKGSLL